MLIEIAGLTNKRLAAATGKSRGYVGQVRTGERTVVPYRFVALAGECFGFCLGEPGQVAVALIVDDPEANAGDKK